jgi:hypothetical protein
MTSRIHRPFLLTALAACGLALSACQSDKHTMVEPKDGTAIGCKECYDEVYKTTHSTGSRWGTSYQQTHSRHECASCKTEISIYSEDGVLKVKCAKCAPEGLACDKCLPPKGYTPPKVNDQPSAK